MSKAKEFLENSKNSTRLTDNELNELTHIVADFLDKFSESEIDRDKVNDALENLCQSLGLMVEEE